MRKAVCLWFIFAKKCYGQISADFYKSILRAVVFGVELFLFRLSSNTNAILGILNGLRGATTYLNVEADIYELHYGEIE